MTSTSATSVVEQLLAHKSVDNNKLDSLSESYSIFAYEALKGTLADTDLRLLLWRGALDDPLNGRDAEHLLRSRLNQHRVAADCRVWAERHLNVRELKRRTRDTWITAGSGSPEPFALTGAGFDAESLGVVPSPDLHLVQDNSDVSTIDSIATQMTRLWNDRKLRDLFALVQFMLKSDSRHVVRAWLIGMNHLLDDKSPATVIADGRIAEVFAAARIYATEG